MRGRRFGFVSAGVAVATMVSFGSLAVSPVVSSAGAAESVSRQAISPGDPVLPVSSVAVDPALTRLDLAGGTPAGGFSQAVVQYRASGAAVPRGRSAGLASSGSARPANQPALQPAATTFGAGTFPAPGVFLVPSQVVSTPSARREAAAAFDSGAGVDVLFGGRGTSTYFNDTWVFDGTNWVAKSPSSKPSTRQGSAMAYDPGTGRTILFGGQNGSTFDADTWSWNGTTWSHLSPATSPPPRRLAMMAYDPALGEIVLFGGVGSSGELGDTWTFDGSTWSQVSTSTAPSARANAGFGYDASGSDLVLYGGENGAGVNVLADTWTYTSSGWTQVSPAHDPGDRTGMGFAYDTTLGHLVLAGGTDGSNDHNDFWLWDGTDWQQGSLPDVPNPRHDYVLVPAPAGFGQLMAFGGISGSTVFSGTGVFDWGQLGTPKNATFITRPVDDRSSYGVNVANGNLVIAANDLSVPGVGIGFALQRRANGLAGYADWSGVGWELTNGFDTWWGALPDGSIVLSGVRGVADMLYFHKSGATFTTPPGVDATLATAGSGYTLTFNASSEKLTFNASGELTGDAGRNGNTITYSWSAGQPAGITDTQGRTYTVTLTSGLITRVTDTSGRHVDYTTTGGFLTQVVDGAGEITNYGYCGCGSLTGIEDPNANTTTLGHATDSRVSSITDPQTTPNETDFDYTAPDSAVSAAWVQTTVTDQNSHDTTYQVAYSGTPAKVTDALGHSRSATYTPNGDVATAVDAIGAGNTTTFGYDALNNPISAQLPTGAETMAQYASGSGCSSSDTIHPYLVKCVEDAQGNQTTFSYDGPGNTLTQDNTATGVSLSYTYNPSTPTCGGKVGQLCSTTDGNSHTTNYHYDSAGDLTSISPAAPLGSISQTFDSLGRVATITDGNGATTTYSYDGDDRITQVLTNGASTCSYSAGTCVSYGYDDNGNQTSMHDVTGLTQYAFDVMNRQTTKTLPSLDTLTLGYDHAGNVTSYTDPGGTVVYGYNAANQLTSLAEPGGSCSGTISLCTSFGVNNNGARTSTTYPGNTVMTTTLDDSGRVSEIKAVNGSTTISDFTYSYTKTGGGQLHQDRWRRQRGDAVAHRSGRRFDHQLRLRRDQRVDLRGGESQRRDDDRGLDVLLRRGREPHRDVNLHIEFGNVFDQPYHVLQLRRGQRADRAER